MKVIVVGAGLTGLFAALKFAAGGHHVTCLEKRPSLSDAGFDIQIPPHGVRLLEEAGVAPSLEAVSVTRKFIEFLDGTTGEKIGRIPMDLSGQGKVNLIAERKVILQALFRHATAAGASVYFNQNITAVHDNHHPSISLEGGSTLSADLIICADGVHSHMQQLVFPTRETSAIPGIHVAFQCKIPYDVLAEEPETLELWNQGIDATMCFCATGHFAVCGSNTLTREFWIVFEQANYEGHHGIGKWNISASMSEVRTLFSDFYGAFQKIFPRHDLCQFWRIAEAREDLSWVSNQGKIVFIGDAAHAMLPGASAGTSNGLEDVVALQEFLRASSAIGETVQAMHHFELFRKPRIEKLRLASRANAIVFALPDGVHRQARNSAWRNLKFNDKAVLAWNHIPADPSANFSDLSYLKWYIEYDITAEARKYIGDIQTR